MDGAAKPEFFISRAGAEKGAAELIAEIVREAGPSATSCPRRRESISTVGAIG
ncbi:MAG: hypothetical protein ACLPIX_14910 [Rhodomicrobium sp.]